MNISLNSDFASLINAMRVENEWADLEKYEIESFILILLLINKGWTYMVVIID